MSGSVRELPRRAQHRVRERSPATAARLTWAVRRRSEPALALVDAFARPGSTVLDLGANWGLFADRMSRLAGPGGSVHAFEPNPVHAATLAALERRYAQLNVHRVALGEAPGEARLQVPVHDGRALSALGRVATGDPQGAPQDGHQEVPVPLSTLADTVAADADVSVVKCDVEGFELPALRGGEALLRASLPVLLVEIEERHSAAGVQPTLEWLTGLGYHGWCVRAGRIAPLDEFDLERDQRAFLGGEFHAFAMPDGYVNDFVFTAPGVDPARSLSG